MTNIIEHILNNPLLIQTILVGVIFGIITLLRKYLSKINETLLNLLTTRFTVTSQAESYDKLVNDLEYILNSSWSVSVKNDYLTGNIIKEFGDVITYGWFRGKFIRVKNETRYANDNAVTQVLTITYLGRSHKYLDSIMLDLEKPIYIKGKTVYIYQERIFGSRSSMIYNSRPLSNVIINKDIKNKITNNLDYFINNKHEYDRLNTPYAYGILLYGPPGTGKTSLIRGIADYLERSIISIGDISTDMFMFMSMNNKKLVVLEELDALLEGVTSGNLSKTDYMKNVLGGLMPLNGSIYIATTNHIEKIDTSLLRAGRFDLVIEIGYLSSVDELIDLIKMYCGELYVNSHDFKVNENITASMIMNEKGNDPIDVFNRYTVSKIV